MLSVVAELRSMMATTPQDEQMREMHKIISQRVPDEAEQAAVFAFIDMGAVINRQPVTINNSNTNNSINTQTASPVLTSTNSTVTPASSSASATSTSKSEKSLSERALAVWAALSWKSVAAFFVFATLVLLSFCQSTDASFLARIQASAITADSLLKSQTDSMRDGKSKAALPSHADSASAKKTKNK
ncbi:MAG: hypothetical protein ACK52I_17225 [Pseudomonadota bacterium]